MTIVASEACDGAEFYLWGVKGPQTIDVKPDGDGLAFSTFTPEGDTTPVTGKTLESIHNVMCFGEPRATLVREAGKIICYGCWRQHCQIEIELLKAQKIREERAKLAILNSRLGKSVVTSN